MKLPRRNFLHLAAGAAALPAASRFAWAQAYPTRPVRLIVPFGSAGATDITARLIGHWLSERLGQQFIIENRPGAGGNIATEAVVRAPPDGYTLLYVTTANASNATLYDKLNFNFIHDIAPVAAIISFPYIMVVNPSVPAKTLPEFIAYAKANPGKINLASPGIGSTPHVNGELFMIMAGIDLVPHHGPGPALTDLIGEQIQVMFDALPSSIEHDKAGRLRPTTTRLEVLPNVPTVGESVPGYEAVLCEGIGAPRNTPAEIVEKLNKEINAALANPKMKARFNYLGNRALPGSPGDFGKLIADETEKWGNVIRAGNIKPE
jgi:tripartite-type tricarboxylate transporter receptor subunit TctC